MNTPATRWEDVYKTQTARIAELERENAALRADAERYRWIKRDNIGVHDVLQLFMSYINCDLDKEIDQTRAKEAKP
jgi:hypothetical protein